MTGRPAAFSALAFASTARVADSEMADTRADILVVGMHTWCHHRLDARQLVSSPGARECFGSTQVVRSAYTLVIANRRAVAQLVESRSPKPAVGGSSPSCPASADWLDHCGLAGPRVVFSSV